MRAAKYGVARHNVLGLEAVLSTGEIIRTGGKMAKVGCAKTPYFLELEDPVKVDLMRRIKQSFDPAGILNPGIYFTAAEA